MNKKKDGIHHQISKVVEYKYFPKGQIIYCEGQRVDYFYLCIKGNVLICQTKTDH